MTIQNAIKSLLPKEGRKTANSIPLQSSGKSVASRSIVGSPQPVYQLGNQTFTDIEEYQSARSAAGVSSAPIGGVLTEKGKAARLEFLKAKAENTPQLLSDIELNDLIKQMPEVTLPEISQLEAEQKAAEEKDLSIASTPFLEKALDIITKPKIVRNSIKDTARLLSSASGFLPDFLQLSTKKTPAVQKAEQEFSDMSSIIDTDIAMVKTGDKTLAEAQQNIDLIINSINKLERETHGLGKLSLRYWIDEGAEIEKQILRERASLENQRKLLIVAAEQARILEIKSGRFG